MLKGDSVRSVAAVPNSLEHTHNPDSTSSQHRLQILQILSQARIDTYLTSKFVRMYVCMSVCLLLFHVKTTKWIGMKFGAEVVDSLE